MITHYQRLLNYIIPDPVHVMYDGRIVKSGDKGLAEELRAKATIGSERSPRPPHNHIWNCGEKMTTTTTQLDIDRDKGDFKYQESHKYDAGVGLDEGTM